MIEKVITQKSENWHQNPGIVFEKGMKCLIL